MLFEDRAMSTAGGNEGCKCIDLSKDLASLDNRSCEMTPGGEKGVMLTLGGPCISLTYGSNACLFHDEIHDPSCQRTDPLPDQYCFRPWCFIDLKECKLYSEERVYRSSYFPVESGVDAFYSYSTCNSTAEDWMNRDDAVHENVLEGKFINAVVPTYVNPYLYKEHPETGEALVSTGDEYLDDSIPFKGVYIDFMREIVELSDGDIKGIAYTHNTRGSSVVHPTSSFTAAVEDVQNGLVDMAVGPFWVTSQRLKMTTFTVPFVYDKTVLVMPRPAENRSLLYQTSKVLRPFQPELWYLVIVTIVLSALLSVWFTDKKKILGGYYRTADKRRSERPHGSGTIQMLTDSVETLKDRKQRRWIAVYTRLIVESMLQKGMFFFGAGVEQDTGATLSHKLLMFGFAFFILVSISVYVANLAAFLTLSGLQSVSTMEGAINGGIKICAHPALKDELLVRWPKAKFVFSDHGTEFYGLLKDYDAKKCQLMVVGREDTTLDPVLMNMYCDRGLVFTNEIATETPMAFPTNQLFAAGISYWTVVGEKRHGISIPIQKKQFPIDVKCSMELSSESESEGKYAPIKVENMFFPLIFYFGFVLAAIAVKLIEKYHHRRHQQRSRETKRRRSHASLFGGASRLHIFANDESCDNNNVTKCNSRRDTGDSSHSSPFDDCEQQVTTVGEKSACREEAISVKKCVSFSSNNIPEFVSPAGQDVTALETSVPCDTPSPLIALASENGDTFSRKEVTSSSNLETKLQRLANSSAINEFFDLVDEIRRQKME